jgi:predicted nucleic acid-binding protein
MYIKKVTANIWNIGKTDPDPEAEFLVDTNAWYFTTYTRASILAVDHPKKYQSQQYARFIKKALDAGSILHRCDLSLAELAHTIEDCERRIFMEYVAKRDVPRKEYLHCEDDEEREQVVSEIESAWGQITGMSQCLGLAIQDPTTKGALNDLRRCRIDGYDVLLLQAMKQGQVTRIITDDADFATVPGIEVFTCNPALIQLAERQGHLQHN